MGTTTNIQIIWIPKKILSKIKPPKKILPKPTQKNPRIENLKPRKILQSSPSLEIWSGVANPPPPPHGSALIRIGFVFAMMVA